MARISPCLILTLIMLHVGCASGPEEIATETTPDTSSQLRLVELEFPEAPGWDLASGHLMFITNPEWGILDGSSYQSGEKPEHFLETTCRTEATAGVVKFRLPASLLGETWAKLSLGLHYDKPSRRSRGTWDAWFLPNYHLPPASDQRELSLSFEGQKATLEPRITVAGESLDTFVGRLNGFFTGAYLSLDRLSVPERPHLHRLLAPVLRASQEPRKGTTLTPHFLAVPRYFRPLCCERRPRPRDRPDEAR